MGKYTFELDDDFLITFYGLLNKPMPNIDLITVEGLKKHMQEMQSIMIEAGLIKTEERNEVEETEEPEEEIAKSVLVIDDLGVITYQLNSVFKKIGYEPVISQEIVDAIEKFKHTAFEFVIMDLFIPTEREGLLLLNELKKIISLKKRNTKIGIMSASNKKEHKKICMQKGADFFIEKVGDWQRLLIEHCQNK